MQGVTSFQRRGHPDLRLAEVLLGEPDGAEHRAGGGAFGPLGDLPAPGAVGCPLWRTSWAARVGHPRYQPARTECGRDARARISCEHDASRPPRRRPQLVAARSARRRSGRARVRRWPATRGRRRDPRRRLHRDVDGAGSCKEREPGPRHRAAGAGHLRWRSKRSQRRVREQLVERHRRAGRAVRRRRALALCDAGDGERRGDRPFCARARRGRVVHAPTATWAWRPPRRRAARGPRRSRRPDASACDDVFRALDRGGGPQRDRRLADLRAAASRRRWPPRCNRRVSPAGCVASCWSAACGSTRDRRSRGSARGRPRSPRRPGGRVRAGAAVIA